MYSKQQHDYMKNSLNKEEFKVLNFQSMSDKKEKKEREGKITVSRDLFNGERKFTAKHRKLKRPKAGCLHARPCWFLF